MKRKISLVLIVLSHVTFTACKNKIASSKATNVSTFCSAEELSYYQDRLKTLQADNKVFTTTNSRDCENEERVAAEACRAGVTYQNWNATRTTNDSGTDPCLKTYGQANKACLDAKKQLNSTDKYRDITEEIQNVGIRIKNCQSSASATPTPLARDTGAEVSPGSQMTQDQLDCQLNGKKYGSTECNCILNEAMWQWDIYHTCRNYNICKADEYLAVDGKCYAKSILKNGGQTSCTAGQILSSAGTCMTAGIYEKCQSIGGVLYTDDSCRDANGNIMPVD